MFKSERLQKLFSLTLVFFMFLSFAFIAKAEDVAEGRTFTITNPYESVDWDTWGHYKTNLHAHSIVSDGEDDFADAIEAYYERGYDILAMTDHGVVNKGWNVKPKTVPILGYSAYIRKINYLSDERYTEIITGADRGGRGMTDVPMGIELNAGVLRKNHVNGFFVDYGQGYWGKENDYETVIKAVHNLGGLTHINHPGDWLGSAKDADIARDPKNIKFFADILKKYDSCLGIEILNSHDRPTCHDRVLWDGLLERLIPQGRNVWGFANSDSHKISDIDTSFAYFMMPENNVENVRTAMENGTFFACGRHAKPELGNDFEAQGDCPLVTRIDVDYDAGTISLEGINYDTIQWVSKGEIIATGEEINIYDYQDEISCYIRAQLLGPGGICFTQAFILDDGSEPEPEPEVDAVEVFWENLIFKLKSTRLYVIIDFIIDKIF